MSSIVKNTLLGTLWLYRAAISNYLPGACRFQPSCSNYAGDALEQHGVRRGLSLTATRLARCHPFTKGGYDPVPPSLECVS